MSKCGLFLTLEKRNICSDESSEQGKKIKRIMINIVKKYLERSNYKSQKSGFEEFFLSHPNYPSVFAVTDSLNSLNIPNLAVKIPKEHFVALPEHFLTIYDREMVLAKKEEASVLMEYDNGRTKRIDFDNFLIRWDQVVIAVESREAEVVQKEKTNKAALPYFLGLGVMIVISFLYKEHTGYSILFLSTALLGLFLSVLILQEKFGYASSVTAKICGISSEVSCNTVLKSDAAKKGLSFSDLPFVFFGSSVLTLLMEPKISVPVLGILSIFSIPIVLYSVWLQKVKLKKWCALCLGVALLLVAQSIFFGLQGDFFTSISFPAAFGVLLPFSLLVTIWLFVKPILESKKSAEDQALDFLKFKRNYALFHFMAKEIKVIQGFEALEGIFFGSRKANAQLTLIISPSCGHCHTAFQEAYTLVRKFPDNLGLRILYNVNPENTENPYKVIAENLLAIHYAFPEKIASAICDWHIDKLDLEEWQTKWGVTRIDMKVNQQLQKQYDWCLMNDFNYTPIKIINNKLYPSEYSISDLKFFLKDFSNEQQPVENQVLLQV